MYTFMGIKFCKTTQNYDMSDPLNSVHVWAIGIGNWSIGVYLGKAFPYVKILINDARKGRPKSLYTWGRS